PYTTLFRSDFRARAFQDVSHLVVTVDRHDRHKHRTGSNRGQVDDDELVPVGQLHENAVATPDAHPAQLGREPVGLASSLAVGQPADTIRHQLAIWRILCPALQAIEEDLVSPPSSLAELRGLLGGVAKPDIRVLHLTDHLLISLTKVRAVRRFRDGACRLLRRAPRSPSRVGSEG